MANWGSVMILTWYYKSNSKINEELTGSSKMYLNLFVLNCYLLIISTLLVLEEL